MKSHERICAVAEISNWKPENRYLVMAAGALAAVALRKPGLATKEATGAYYSVAYEMKLAENLYPCCPALRSL